MRNSPLIVLPLDLILGGAARYYFHKEATKDVLCASSYAAQWRIQRGAEGADALPPKITLRCDKAQATLRNRSKSLELYIAQKWQTTF